MTDTIGTKGSDGVAAVAFEGVATALMHLYANATVFTAELHAILPAPQHIETTNLHHSVIYSDLLNSVMHSCHTLVLKTIRSSEYGHLPHGSVSRVLLSVFVGIPATLGLQAVNERTAKQRALAQEESCHVSMYRTKMSYQH